MRICILILTFTYLSLSASGQIIRGTIYDYNTNEPVCCATIYFNGTFVGTSSDENGNFEVNIRENKSMPITFSAIGYFSLTLENVSETDWLNIYLDPKIYEIQDVIVSAKSLERKRKRYLKLFKDEFIGTTENAKECIILNEEDITFNYDSDKDTLRAFALEPILIENLALGYKITYYLDIFEYYKRTESTFFCGNIIFNEDLTHDEAQTEYYNYRRDQTYFGSRMHLIRVMCSDSLGLASSGFRIRTPSHKPLDLKEIAYSDDRNNRFISFDTNILIEYESRTSYIEFLLDSVYIDKSGYFNTGLKWWGEMGKQRVADWLPYEYFPNETQF